MLKIIIKNAKIIRTGISFEFKGVKYFVKRTYLDNHIEIDLNKLENAVLTIEESKLNETKNYTYINEVNSIDLVNNQTGDTKEIKLTQLKDETFKGIKEDLYERVEENFATFESKTTFRDVHLKTNFKVKNYNLGDKRVDFDAELSVIQNFINSGATKTLTNETGISSLILSLIIEVIKYRNKDDLYISCDRKYSVNLQNNIDELFKVIDLFNDIFKKDISKKVEWAKESIILKTNETNEIIIGNEETTLISLSEIDIKSELPSFISKKQVKYKKLNKETIDEIASFVFEKQWITNLKHEQFQAIEKLLTKNGNLLAVLKTGFGKSLIYQMFSFMQPVIIMAVFPINALIEDQSLILRETNGFEFTMSNEQIKNNKNRIYNSTISHKRLFLITAERLENEEVNKTFKELSNFIGSVVFDEAHCISEWGHDFRPSYLVVRHVVQNIKNINSELKIIALTATAAPYIQKDIMKILNISNQGLINLADVTGLERKELKYNLIKKEDGGETKKKRQKTFWGEVALEVADEQKYNDGVSILYFIYAGQGRWMNQASAEFAYRESYIPNTGVFTGSVKEITKEDGTQESTKSFEKFKNLDVLFATKSFGMGVNIENCNYVALIQPPSSLEDLYQQAGRAGRRGQDSNVDVFYSSVHLMDPMSENSPFSFFLSNDIIRMKMQPLILEEIIKILKENDFNDLVINMWTIFMKCKEWAIGYFTKDKFNNYFKWAIAHLINEFGVIDYYTVKYRGMDISEMRIFVNESIKSVSDIEERLDKTIVKYALESEGDLLYEKIQTYYLFYFAEIEKQKKTGINIFVNKLKEIDNLITFDSNKIINEAINDYYRTRNESNYTFADKYYKAMEENVSSDELKDMLIKASKKQNIRDLVEVLARYPISLEYTMATSLLIWYLFDEQPIIDSLENIWTLNYKNEYIKNIVEELFIKIEEEHDDSERKKQTQSLLIKTEKYRKVIEVKQKIKILRGLYD